MKIILITILIVLFPPILGGLTIMLVESNVNYSFHEYFLTLKIVSVGAFFIGISLPTLILLAARLCHDNHNLLLLIFKPLLRTTQLFTVFLVASHGFLLTVSLFFLEAYFLHRVHGILFFLLGVASVWTALKVLWFSLTKIKEPQTQVVGQLIKKDEQRKLWKLIREVCAKTHCTEPDNVIVGISPIFFVTETTVVTQSEKFSGRTLYISLPFTRLLKPIELKAIIAHEMGHFIGEDTKFSKRLYPIYRGVSNTISILYSSTIYREGSGKTTGISVLPSLIINHFFLSCFSFIETEIGRERELKADQVAEKSFGRNNFAESLIKAHLYGALWPLIEKAMQEALYREEIITNLSLYFSFLMKKLNVEKAQKLLENFHTEHPTDTHPSLSIRLKQLNIKVTIDMLEKIVNDNSHQCIEIFEKINQIEENLTLIETKLMIDRLNNKTY